MSVIVDPFKLLRAKRAFPLNETATELYYNEKRYDKFYGDAKRL